MNEPPLPVEGLRVLDLGTVVAGPGVAARLGDFGTEVVKQDPPRREAAGFGDLAGVP